MDAEHWRELRHHFESLLELPDANSREQYLAAIQSPVMRTELVSMLSRHSQEAALDQPAANLIASVIAGGNHQDDWGREQLGKRVGAYQLDSVLGAGGMGMVYRAHRIEGGFEQQVAIKMILNAHPGTRARFQKEQSILAGLNHPIIAQLLDGGNTDAGLPYLAMEYVDGVPITDYCRDHLPDVDGRLALLLKVAAALSYAHRNLVIHRDIKPSNILVTLASGRPKLLDFGIAKMVDESGARMLTQQQFGPMTPAYAAPEQFKGTAITVATDIYQFGVLMFRLITGRLPFDVNPEDALAWGRAVLESEPMTLRRAVVESRRAGVTRSTDAVASVGRELDRDLNAIVRTAMAKDPSQRYGSMDALIADVDAFLARRPVQARHGGRWYFASRFLYRNRWAVGLGTAAILGLLNLTALALLQTQRARAEAERVQLSAQFMEEVLKAADPIDNNKPGIRTAIDLMDAATGSMQSKLAKHPELAGPTAMLIANAYANLGSISRAYPLYVQAIEQLRRSKVAPLVLAEALERAAYGAQRNGELRQCEQWLDELAGLLQGDSVQVRRLRDGLLGTRWQIARDAGNSELALQLAEEGLRNVEHQTRALDRELQTAYRRRGTILTDLARFQEAGRDLHKSLEIANRAFGPKHGRTLLARQTLGWFYTESGDPRRGIVELEPLAEPMRLVFGEYSQQYASNWHNRGNAYRAIGEIVKALKAYRSAAACYRGSTAGNSAQVGWALINVADILLKQGKYEQARAVFLEVESAWKNSVSTSAPIWAPLRLNQGRVELQLGQLNDAAQYINASVVNFRKHQPNSVYLAQALALQAEIASKLDAKPEAIAHYQEAIAILSDCLGSQINAECAMPEKAKDLEKWQSAYQALQQL